VVAGTRDRLARAYHTVGKLDSAIRLYEESLKLNKSKSGPNSRFNLYNTQGLAAAYLAVGKLDKALPHFEEAVRLMKAEFGPNHLYTIASLVTLAGVYAEAGDTAKAFVLLAEVRKRLPKERRPWRRPGTRMSWSPG
jgi:non-specific serine/threonine protein kinase